MGEPLNRKKNGIFQGTIDNWYTHKDIKSAVEWLKDMIKGAMVQHEAISMTKQFGTEENKKIASAHLNAYKHTLKRIDETFPDLRPKGEPNRN